MGIIIYLVGGFNHFLFFHIFGIVSPTDFHIFLEGLKPPTRYIYIYIIVHIFIELDDGKILTGNPNQFDGKNPWVSG